jgi:hypothetical protein
MFNLKRLFTEPYEVRPHTWHARVYRYWHNHAEFKTTGYQENLCHYWRVITFWGPLSWVLYGRIARVPIWVPILIAQTVGMFTIVAAESWLSLALFFEVIPVILLVGYAPKELKERSQARAKLIIAPVEAALTPPARWFFGAKALKVITPFRVVALAVIAYGLYSKPIVLLWVVGIVAVVIGAACLLTALEAIFSAIANTIKYRFGAGYREPRRHAVRESLTLVAHVVAAKKRKVCPIVVFRDE